MTFSRHRSIHLKGDRGFTIVELLVASTVTLVISLILVSIIASILGSWNRLSGTLTTGAQARLVLDMMTQDLQNAIYDDDGQVWLAASVLHGPDVAQNRRGWSEERQNAATRKPLQNEPDYFRLLPEWGDGPPGDLNNPPDGPFNAETMPWRYGAGGTWLRFFTTGPHPTEAQLPRAVAYQIIRRPVNASPQAEIRYMLYRSTVSAANTMAIRYHLGTFSPANPPVPEYDISVDPGASPFYNASASSGAENDPPPGHPAVVRRPRLDEVIAGDVIDFGVRFYTRNAAGELNLVFPIDNRPIHSTTGRASDNDRHYFAGEIDANGNLIEYPEVIDLFIRVLTPEGVKQIRNFEASPANVTQPRTWWEIAEEHSHVYVRRVQIRR